MNTVYISGLRISTVIGVYDWERNIQQIVVVDLQMSADNQRAADEDNLNYTLDYGAMPQLLLRSLRPAVTNY